MKKKPFFAIIIVALIIVLIGSTFFSKKHKKFKGDNQLTVNTALTEIRPMPIETSFTGTIEPLKSVSIRPQITGTITKIAINAGQDVKAGQLLFQIDQGPFAASLKQADANRQKSAAQLKENIANVNRLEKLVKKGYVSQQQFDQAVSEAAVQKATVAADQEMVNQAKIQLNYSSIKAPLDGKTGNLTIKEGDLVTAANETPLVTINQMDPILVNFNLPQNNLPQLMTYQAKNPIKIEVWNDTKSQLLGKGELVFIDNNINSATGTILLKAKIPNPNHLLWPGLMVTVKLILTTENKAIVIPSIAVRVDQEGTFVYKIIDNKARVQRVTVNRQIGELTVISKGLSKGEQIITIAPPDIKDLSEIQIASSKL